MTSAQGYAVDTVRIWYSTIQTRFFENFCYYGRGRKINLIIRFSKVILKNATCDLEKKLSFWPTYICKLLNAD